MAFGVGYLLCQINSCGVFGTFAKEVPIMDLKLLRVAKGVEHADLVVINGKIVNVYSGEIYEGGVAVSGDKIAAIGDVAYCIGPETEIVDAKGNYLTPGFIEGHMHPESTSMAIRNFAACILKRGTTSVMTDLHEVGVVSGLEGIEAILKEARTTHVKFYFVVPSHVPFSPNLETSGGRFYPSIIAEALKREDAVGLSECVGPYILMEHPELLESMADARSMGKSLQGHLPVLYGPEMNACLAAGVTTCHEATSEEDVFERLRNGCHLMMRQGSSAMNLPDLINTILSHDLNTSMISIITDDLDTLGLYKDGHLDSAVRVALSSGVDFVTAIQMVTLHAARAFNLDSYIGGLAPGKVADINITSGPDDFKVLSVVAKGELVCRDEEMIVDYPPAEHAPVLLNTIKLLEEITPESLQIRVSSEASKVKVLVMDTLQEMPYTLGREVELEVKDGVVQCDPNQDVLYIAQVERHGKNGNIGKAFMGGFRLTGGALASSVGHDNHNIIVLGDNFEDMAIAVNHVAALNGGQAIVRNGKVEADVAYPICGLMSDLPLEELVEKKMKLEAVAREMGTGIPVPFMFLSFICLAAIPEYAVTDHGFIDVNLQKVIDPILEIIE